MGQPTTVSEQTETLEIARDQWLPFLSEFTRANRGAHGQIEVLGSEIGRFVETEDRPFDGIAADVKDREDAIWIHFGANPDDIISHAVSNVTAIRARSATAQLGPALEIDAADGTRTILTLSRPEDFALPPPPGGKSS